MYVGFLSHGGSPVITMLALRHDMDVLGVALF